MKTCVKALCTTLALTAVLSFGLSAHAISYTDSSQIQYKTAVGVMSGTGVISGYTDGSFCPKDPITREQAAKLVAFAAIGEDAVSRLPRVDTGFSDVPAARWSAPYVNWCRENGIIDGVSEKTFDPNGKVTGYQLSKMLLCAVGYGQIGEYSGASWELEAAKGGFAKGIFTGITESNPGQNVTREDAAFYLFNTITKLEKVVYDEAAGKYVPADGTEEADNTFGASVFGIVTNGDKATTFTGTVTENSANGQKGTTISGTHYDYETGAAYLGHRVTVYTNGQAAPKTRVYYIADESTTVELKAAISGRELFQKTIGENVTVAKNVLVFNEKGLVSEETAIPGFDTAACTAPAGSYVYNDGVITAYFPHFEEFAAAVGETKDGNIRIGAKTYPVDSVYCELGALSKGEIVLARAIGDKLSVTPATILTGRVTKTETASDGSVTYTVSGAKLSVSKIRVEGAIDTVPAPVPVTLYRFYCDSDCAVFAIQLAH